jgi:hypothetical protein
MANNQEEIDTEAGDAEAGSLPAGAARGPQLDALAGPEGGDEGRRLASYWKQQLDDVHDEMRKWVKRGHTIEKRYRDERSRIDEEGQRRYNALWSNVQILHPALYGRLPTPVVERRFKDKDPAGRGAAQMLERALRNEIEFCGIDEAINRCVMDYLLAGRGVPWVRYEPEVEAGVSLPVETGLDLRDAQGPIESEDDSIAEEKLEQTGDRIARESTPVDYIPWTDFFTFPARARTWAEVVAVGKRVYLTRDELIENFGKKIGKAIPLEKDDRERRRQAETVVPEMEASKKGEVVEIWNRADEKVYWIAEGYEYLCNRKDDPLQLENFFPVPRPIYANATNNTLTPVPDYIQYQDQAIQVDELTQRIHMLSKACKVAGLYDASQKDMQRLLDESVENELIPVDQWAAFAEKGGVAGVMSLLPLKEIIGVLNELMALKEKIIAEMDRLTGITDVLRGTTDARETMGGQRLKSNNSGTRLQRRQGEVARLCRDTLRIMAEIMSMHFSPKSLIEVSGALYEEGLGAPDIDLLPPGAATPGPSGAPSQPVLPPSAGPAALGPAGSPQSPAGPAPGQNVVPFPGTPPAMPGAMAPPQLPPELMAKLEGFQRIAAAIALLRNEKLRGFRVDIEVDSSVYGDQAQEKADRTEFVGAVTKFMQAAMAMGAQMPESVPLLAKLLQFAVRGFKAGRDLEVAIEEFGDEAVQVAKKRAQQQGQQPNPLQIKAQADALKAQSDVKVAEINAQSDQQKAAADAQAEQMKTAREQQQAQAQAQSDATDLEMRRMEMQIKVLELQNRHLELQEQAAQRQHEARQGTAERAADIAKQVMAPPVPQQAAAGGL